MIVIGKATVLRDMIEALVAAEVGVEVEAGHHITEPHQVEL